MDPKPAPKRKRPYKPPTIRTDKVYERRALACSKARPNQTGCMAVPSTS